MPVKRGKYVREVIEILHKHGPQTLQGIASMGQMNEDYYRASVLSRLIEEGEVVIVAGKYTLADGVVPTWPFEILASRAMSEAMANMPTKIKPLTGAEAAKLLYPAGDDLPASHPAHYPPPKTYNDFKTPEPTVVMAGGKIPRHKATELVLGLAWLQDMPDINSVLAHYCDTHKASFKVVDTGKKTGERIEFSTKE